MITGVTAVVFGLVPLVQFRHLALADALKQGSRTISGVAGSRRLRALLVCSEVALAFVLLIGAGLLMQTFTRLRNVDLGCRTQNILTLRMPASDKYRESNQIVTYQSEVLRRVSAIPGVISAGFTNHIPLVVKGDISGVGAEGHDPQRRFQCRVRMAGPGYLRTMGIPLRRGRDVEERDVQGAPMVVVINETLARMVWPGQDPIGRRLRLGEHFVPVIGVVGDIHQSGLDVPSSPEFYISSLQAPFPPTSLAIHTKVEPTSLAAAVRQAIWSIDPDQPITALASMEEILDRELFQRKVQTTLLAAFASLALLLAAVGLYGVLACLVSQQIPEIGTRMALGATPFQILRTILGHGFRLTLIGLGCGLVASLAVSSLLGAVLFGVKPTDPMTYGAVAIVLLVTAGLACYLPARRAMQVDPIVALRED
jgi:predicted permease